MSYAALKIDDLRTDIICNFSNRPLKMMLMKVFVSSHRHAIESSYQVIVSGYQVSGSYHTDEF